MPDSCPATATGMRAQATVGSRPPQYADDSVARLTEIIQDTWAEHLPRDFDTAAAGWPLGPRLQRHSGEQIHGPRFPISDLLFSGGRGRNKST